MKVKKQLLLPGLAAVTLGLAVSLTATANVGATSDNGSAKPKFAMQCEHPGFKHFGFNSMKDCQDFVGGHTPGQQGHGYGGDGGGHNTVHNVLGDVFSHIGSIVGSTINVTINFVTNIFH